MRESLTNEGYAQTQEKLRDLQRRLAEIEKRTDLTPEQLASVRRSYRMMMREFTEDLKLLETRHAKNSLTAAD